MATDWGNVGESAGTGAMIGAAAGTVVPGLGTLAGAGVGALAGGLYGYLSGGSLFDLGAGTVNGSSYLNDYWKHSADQNAALGAVGNWAFTGKGPSAAQAILATNRGQNTQNAIGAAKSMAGGNQALAQTMASNQAATANAAATRNAAIIRSQEQQQMVDNYLKGVQAARDTDVEYYGKRMGVDLENAERKAGFFGDMVSGVGGGLGGLFG